LFVRLHRGDRHPVEWEEQHEDENRHRQVEHHHPPWQAVQVAHTFGIVGQDDIGGVGIGRHIFLPRAFPFLRSMEMPCLFVFTQF
jgi:hypothetical protein